MPGIPVYLLMLVFMFAGLMPEQRLKRLPERSFRPPTCFATPDHGTTVFDSETAAAIQLAINAAEAGATVKVAGTCLGLPLVPRPVNYPGTQMELRSLVITKSLHIQGGYTVLDWQQPQPNAHSTIDAQGLGRPLTIVGADLVVVEHLTFSNGDATGLGGTATPNVDLGGGVYVLESKVAFKHVDIHTNVANAGGGLYISSAPVFLEALTIRENTAVLGGGIWTNTDLKMLETQIISNTAGRRGGGIYLNNVSDPNITLWLEDSSLSLNNAVEQGGAIYAQGGFIQGQHVLITQNSASNGFGGGIATQGSLNLYRSELAQNEATTAGGGLFADESSREIELFSTNVISNTAANGGGVLSHATTFSLRDALVRGNSGGGVHVVQAQPGIACQAIVYDVRIESNLGGGILGDGCSADLDTVRIKDNHSDANPLTFGGIKLRNTSAQLQRVSILSNTTTTDGGGILITNQSTTEHNVILDSVTISNNQATGAGGGLALQAANHTLVELRNATLGDNIAQFGSAIDLRSTLEQHQRSPATAPELRVINTLISQPTSACFLDGGHVHDAGWNLISDASCGTVAWRAIQLGPLIETDSGMLYHELIANSPAIDSGICIAEADQRSYPRPSRHSRFCDIGAIESERTTTMKYRVYLPTAQR